MNKNREGIICIAEERQKMMENKNRILVIAAHPANEVLGCGGTIARLTSEGHKVYILILGGGTISQKDKNLSGKRKDIQKKRVNQIYNTDKIIGVSDIFIYDFPNGRFKWFLLDIIKVIKRIREKVRPHIIYTHSKGDLDIDHRITYKAVLAVCCPVKGESANAIYSFEMPYSTKLVSQSNFMPNLFNDITEYLDQKILALDTYNTVIGNFPYTFSIKSVRNVAAKWGNKVGISCAEAFEVIRLVSEGKHHILLYNAIKTDCRKLWLWRNHPYARENSFNKKPILWDDHKKWFNSKIKDPNTKIYIAKQENNAIGTIRFEPKRNFFRTSIALNPLFFGKGFGTEIIAQGTKKFLSELCTSKPIFAAIKNGNIIAEKAFSHAGYKYFKGRTWIFKASYEKNVPGELLMPYYKQEKAQKELKICIMAGRQAGIVGFLTLLAKGYRLMAAVSYFEALDKMLKFFKVPIYSTIKDKNFCNALTDSDLLISVHSREIVSAPQLSLPRLGCINVHPYLYKYKGADPVGRAFKDRNFKGSVGVHWMIPEVDKGKMIIEEFIDTSGATSVDEIYNKLYPSYSSTILKALDIITQKKRLNR